MGATRPIVLAALAVGCGAVDEPRPIATPRARVVHVSVRYEAPVAGTHGRSSASQWRPARRARYVVLAESNRVAARGSLDDEGRAHARLPPDARWLEVESRITEGATLAVTSDGLGRRPHRLRMPLPRDQNRVAMEITREDDESAPFCALDAMLDGIEAARRWSGRSFPALFARWTPGADDSSSYWPSPIGLTEEDRRYHIRLGGQDAYDAHAVLHEVGHFVFHRMGTTSSGGGSHNPEVVVDPGLAWEEGRATWFAALVRGEPRYADARGEEPSGSTFAVDLERRAPADAPDRLDSEATVWRVLWDLVDGSAGVADQDDDGIAIDPAKLVRAMDALGSEPELYPSLSAFLLVLGEREALPAGAVARMLEHTSTPAELRVDQRDALWPPFLEVGQRQQSTLLGLDQPTADGARTRLSRHVIRVRVQQPGLLRITIELTRGRRRDLAASVAQRIGADVSRVAPAVERFLDEQGVSVSMSLEGLDGRALARWQLESGTHQHEHFVPEPGVYLLTLRQWQIVPARYELSAELDAL